MFIETVHHGAVASPVPMAALHVDWRRVASLVALSRAVDELEEGRLLSERKVRYQFSARGHELAQVLLASWIDQPRDAVSVYYRSRPLMLALGLDVEDALAATMARAGGLTDGRDIGVVFNLLKEDGPTVLPAAGDVGAQFTPAVGWAQAIEYHRRVLGDRSYEGAIAVALGGDGAAATGGFWSALTIAATCALPILFFIEDNGYALSVPSTKQTPGGNIARNLAAFQSLFVGDFEGDDPGQLARQIESAVHFVRAERRPALLRVRVPRLCGHSGQDNQAYRSSDELAEERKRDPLEQLYLHLVPRIMTDPEFHALVLQAKEKVESALSRAEARGRPDPKGVRRHAFCEVRTDGTWELQRAGGLAASGYEPPPATEEPAPEAVRINMLTAVRRTLEHELRINPRLLLFGEDVGKKGGVHAATMGLQELFGEHRVFDTSLSEEGIIGRAVGMALAGLLPVAEIQFRKYADAAMEQLHNCGTIRWRTNNRFAAPIVVRTPCGYAGRCGDPWHSVSDEVAFAHAVGWQVLYPSNAEDAVGLLRSALRGNNPSILLEHRYLLDAAWARRPYPGDSFIVRPGKARIVRTGSQLTLVTWGAMVERCELSATEARASVEIIDLRTIVPWDRETVLASVRKTRRCLVVHEDTLLAGFGAEISATLAAEAFYELDAPVARLAVPNVPIPYEMGLMEAVLPSAAEIAAKIFELVHS